MVKHVVKEPFLTRVGTICRRLSRKAFFMFKFGVLYLRRGREARCFFKSGVSIFNTPIQRIQPDERGGYLTCSGTNKGPRRCAPPHDCNGCLGLAETPDLLGLIEGLDFLCVLPDAPQNRVSYLALLIFKEKAHAIRPTLQFTGEDIFLHHGKQREPDMLPT